MLDCCVVAPTVSPADTIAALAAVSLSPTTFGTGTVLGGVSYAFTAPEESV